MARRHYLVSYDVADDKRRTRIFKLLQGVGNHVQYSVFFCDLNPRELAQVRGRLHTLIDHAQDQILLLDLGPEQPAREHGLDVLGKAYQAPIRVQIV